MKKNSLWFLFFNLLGLCQNINLSHTFKIFTLLVRSVYAASVHAAPDPGADMHHMLEILEHRAGMDLGGGAHPPKVSKMSRFR